MQVMTYVVQVRDRAGRTIRLGSPNAPVTQPALWGANDTHGPTVFTDVEQGLRFCVDMQREFPRWTYHLIPANEVEVQVPTPTMASAVRDREALNAAAARRNMDADRLAFGRD